MGNDQIHPEKVTKPIQLLAAWLAGLIIVNGAFLTGAATIKHPEWAAGALVIAALANVPVFLAALFLLQTKFRPEMQEDVYYAKHLERVYSSQTRQTEVVQLKQDARIVTREKGRAPISIQRFRDISVWINDLLPQYKELAAALRSRGIVADETFGSKSDPPVPPKHFVIAIGPTVPMALVKKVVEVSSHFGLEGLADARKENELFDISAGRIYIGAYESDSEDQFIAVTPGILKSIASPDFGENDLQSLLRRI